jgi:hypothetical protein
MNKNMTIEISQTLEKWWLHKNWLNTRKATASIAHKQIEVED